MLSFSVSEWCRLEQWIQWIIWIQVLELWLVTSEQGLTIKWMGVISLNNHLSFFSLHSQQERDDSFVCLNTMKYFLPPTSRIMTDIKWLLVLWLLQSWVYTGFKYENWAGNCSSTHWCCNKYSNLNKFYCNMRKYDQRRELKKNLMMKWWCYHQIVWTCWGEPKIRQFILLQSWSSLCLVHPLNLSTINSWLTCM